MAEDTTSQDAAQQDAEAQAEVDTIDWKAEARKWEARAKENKGAADQLAELEKQDEAAKSDLEKATAKAERALKELEELKSAQRRAELIKAAAKSNDVDEELLSMMSGDDEEAIKANAKTLKDKMAKISRYPEINDKGASNTKTGMTKEEILKIKNPKEQLRAAMENPQAFD